MRGCIGKLVEISEWFGNREEKGRGGHGCGYGGCGSRGVGRCVPYIGYGYGESTMIDMVGIGGCNTSVRELKMCCGWEA